MILMAIGWGSWTATHVACSELPAVVIFSMIVGWQARGRVEGLSR